MVYPIPSEGIIGYLKGKAGLEVYDFKYSKVNTDNHVKNLQLIQPYLKEFESNLMANNDAYGEKGRCNVLEQMKPEVMEILKKLNPYQIEHMLLLYKVENCIDRIFTGGMDEFMEMHVKDENKKNEFTQLHQALIKDNIGHYMTKDRFSMKQVLDKITDIVLEIDKNITKETIEEKLITSVKNAALDLDLIDTDLTKRYTLYVGASLEEADYEVAKTICNIEEGEFKNMEKKVLQDNEFIPPVSPMIPGYYLDVCKQIIAKKICKEGFDGCDKPANVKAQFLIIQHNIKDVLTATKTLYPNKWNYFRKTKAPKGRPLIDESMLYYQPGGLGYELNHPNQLNMFRNPKNPAPLGHLKLRSASKAKGATKLIQGVNVHGNSGANPVFNVLNLNGVAVNQQKMNFIPQYSRPIVGIHRDSSVLRSRIPSRHQNQQDPLTQMYTNFNPAVGRSISQLRNVSNTTQNSPSNAQSDNRKKRNLGMADYNQQLLDTQLNQIMKPYEERAYKVLEKMNLHRRQGSGANYNMNKISGDVSRDFFPGYDFQNNQSHVRVGLGDHLNGRTNVFKLPQTKFRVNNTSMQGQYPFMNPATNQNTNQMPVTNQQRTGQPGLNQMLAQQHIKPLY